jgi:histone H3
MTRTVGGSRNATPTRARASGGKSPHILSAKKQRVGAIPAAGAAAARSSRRYRPGERALMEIRKFQKSGDLLLRRLPFTRLVRCEKWGDG